MAEWVNGLAFRRVQFSDTGMPVIKIAEIKGGITGQTKRTEQSFDESVLVRAGDLLFSWSGQPETSIDAFLWRGPDGWLNQHVFRVTPSAGVEPEFFYYLLKYLNPNFVGIARNKQTTGLGHVTKGDLKHLEAGCPELAEQRAIAHVLGSLDDKIELNRRMNETLEGMARALFKSWFVDFDPVRAKLQGRDPGVGEQMTDAFPDSFEKSDVGEIPTGWRVDGLGEWVNALSGGTPSRKTRALWGGSIPWISPKVMTSIHADEADEYVTEDAIGNGTRLAPAGSTLVMVRGMGLHSAVRVSQARSEVTFNQDVKALVPSRIDADLLLFALLNAQQDLLARVGVSGHGTGRLPTDVLLEQSVTLPPVETQRILARPFSRLNRRIAVAREECRVLATLRDTLLPKLISGELRVPDAERAVERAPNA